MKWRLLFVVALCVGIAKAELTLEQVAQLDKAIVKSDAAAVEKVLGTSDSSQIARILQQVETAQGEAGKYAKLAESVAATRATKTKITDDKARKLMLQGGVMVLLGVSKTVSDFLLKTDNASEEGETAGTLSADITVNAGIIGWGGYTFWNGWNRRQPSLQLSDAQRIMALVSGVRSGNTGEAVAVDVADDDDDDDDDDSVTGANSPSRNRRSRSHRRRS